MKSLASHPASTILRFFAICFASTLILCAAPFLAHAEEARVASVGSSSKGGYYEIDGTYIGDSSGAALMGFNTSRSLTESAQRGSGDPMGKTLGLVPSELSVFGGYIGGRTSGYDKGQLDDLTVSNIPTKNLGDIREPIIDITSDRNPNDINNVSKYPGKTIAADVNRDGIDELVFFYANTDANYYGYNQYYLDVYDTSSGKLLIREFVTNQDPVTSYNSTHWNSLFQIAVGDFDGNGCDDVAVYIYDIHGDIGGSYLWTYYFGVISGKPYMDWIEEVTVYSDNRETSARTISEKKYLPGHLVAGDVNDDGNDDLVFAYQATAGEDNTSIKILSIPQGMGMADRKSYTLENIQPDGTSGRVAQMGSVGVGDVDNDGYQELIVGGYLGNSGSDGELYLSYLEWDHNRDEMDWTFKGYTCLRDDDGTAATTGSSLINHHPADTSLFLDNSEGKGMEWSRYVCSTDWTVPLSTVSLSGMVNDTSLDQVFFGMWFYQLENGRFVPYQNTSSFPYLNCDNNNVSVTSMGAIITDEDAPTKADLDGLSLSLARETFLMTVRIDRNGSSGGDAYTEVYAFSSNGIYLVKSTRSIGSCDWNNTEYYPRFALLNADSDGVFMELAVHEFIYAEPTVNAYIMAPPYFQDIYDTNGYDSGTTTIVDVSGGTQELGGSLNVTAEASIGFGPKRARMGGSLAGMWTGTWKDGSSWDYQFSISTSKGEDRVVMHAIPTDIYYYRVFTYDDSMKRVEVLSDETTGDNLFTVMMPCRPVTVSLTVDDYQKRVLDYNNNITDYNINEAYISDLESLPLVSEFHAHEPGDPTTYSSEVPGINKETDLAQSKTTISLDHANSFGAGSQALQVTYKTTSSSTQQGGIKLGFKIAEEGWFQDLGLNIAANPQVIDTKSSYEGTTYKGEVKAIANSEFYQGYNYSCQLYAGTKVPDKVKALGEDRNRYLIVGYKTFNVTGQPSAARNIATSNISAHSMDISFVLPGTVSSLFMASRYDLQRHNAQTNAWDTIKTFYPTGGADTKHTFTDTDLKASTTYRYQVVAVKVSSSGLPPKTNPRGVEATTLVAPSFPVTFDGGAYANVWGFYFVDGTRYSMMSGANVPEGATVEVVCSPNERYEVDGWTVAGVDPATCNLTSQKATVPSIRGPVTITPNVVRAQANVLVGHGESGSVKATYVGDMTQKLEAGTAAVVDKGGILVVDALPDAGYEVDAWLVGTSEADAAPLADYAEASLRQTVTGNTYVKATFKPKEMVDLSISSLVEGVSPDACVNDGSIVVYEDDVRVAEIASVPWGEAANISLTKGARATLLVTPPSGTTHTSAQLGGQTLAPVDGLYVIESVEAAASLTFNFAVSGKTLSYSMVNEGSSGATIAASSQGVSLKSGDTFQPQKDVVVAATIPTDGQREVLGVKRWVRNGLVVVDAAGKPVTSHALTSSAEQSDLNVLAVLETLPTFDLAKAPQSITVNESIDVDVASFCADADGDPVHVVSAYSTNSECLKVALKEPVGSAETSVFTLAGSKATGADEKVEVVLVVSDSNGNRENVTLSLEVKAAEIVFEDVRLLDAALPGGGGNAIVEVQGENLASIGGFAAVATPDPASSAAVVSGSFALKEGSSNIWQAVLAIPKNASPVDSLNYSVSLTGAIGGEVKQYELSQKLTVLPHVERGSLDKTEAAFDYASPTDVSVKATMGSTSDVALYHAGRQLTQGDHYTYVADGSSAGKATLTLTSKYLASLNYLAGTRADFEVRFLLADRSTLGTSYLSVVYEDQRPSYSVAFKRGANADDKSITGDDPASRTLKQGELTTLPENPYRKAGSWFVGWRCSADDKLYSARSLYTMPDKNVEFTAQWVAAGILSASLQLGDVAWTSWQGSTRELFFSGPLNFTLTNLPEADGVERFYKIVKLPEGLEKATRTGMETPDPNDKDWLPYTPGTDISLKEDGTYRIVAYMSDARGKYRFLTTDRLTIDTTPPELSIDYDHDGVWTSDPAASATINGSDPHVNKLLYLYGSSLIASGPSSPQITPLEDGRYELAAIAADKVGNRAVSSALVMKDTVSPVLKLQVVSGAVPESQQIVVLPTIGASGLARVEVAMGKDAQSDFKDITESYAGGLKDLGLGWYTVRITNGLGETVAASAEITQVPPQVDPGDPGSNNPGNAGNGSDNQGGAGAGGGKGAVLLSTGDSSLVWIAGGLLSLASLVVALTAKAAARRSR